MINTQGREVPQPEGISRATYEEKPGVKDRYLQSEDSQDSGMSLQLKTCSDSNRACNAKKYHKRAANY